MPKLGLFPRLLIAFLLVIGVASVTLFVAGLTFGPVLLERHLVSMGLSPDNPTPGTETMLTDLRVNYRDALSQSLLWAVAVAALIAGGDKLFHHETGGVAPATDGTGERAHRYREL